MEEETSYCSYGEAYEVNCARYGREADQPISHFKKRCCSPNGNLISDPDGTLRLQVCRSAGFWPLQHATTANSHSCRAAGRLCSHVAIEIFEGYREDDCGAPSSGTRGLSSWNGSCRHTRR